MGSKIEINFKTELEFWFAWDIGRLDTEGISAICDLVPDWDRMWKLFVYFSLDDSLPEVPLWSQPEWVYNLFMLTFEDIWKQIRKGDFWLSRREDTSMPTVWV